MKKKLPVSDREIRSLMSYLKSSSGRFMLNEVNGEMWWSDSYVMLPVDPVVTALLEDYNLTPEPMVCRIDRTIVRQIGIDAPDMAAMFKQATEPLKKASMPLTQVTLDGMALTVELPVGGVLELWSSDGGVTVTHRFNRRLMNLMRTAGAARGARSFVVGDSTSPATQSDGDGKPVGLVMPIRATATLATWADAA